MTPTLFAIVAGALVTGWVVTGLVRHYALSRSILDHPNQRSSHTLPTPLGGGWVLAVPVLAAIAAGRALGWLDPNMALGLGGGAAAMAVVGWIDDRMGVRPRYRLIVQGAAALWLITWVGGFDSLDLGFTRLPLGRLGNVIGVLGVVWCTNLYNFMDGIDGIAGLEAVSVATVGGILLLLGGSMGLAGIALATAAASAGFLLWNRPPARIFMGDAGSGLLGFLFAGLAIAGEAQHTVPVLVWVLLLGVFVADATIVLVSRMARGEEWYSAHRGHLYQRLVQAGWTHGRVDWAVGALNVGLAALAVSAWHWRQALLSVSIAGFVGVGLIYAVAARAIAVPSTPPTPSPASH